MGNVREPQNADISGSRAKLERLVLERLFAIAYALQHGVYTSFASDGMSFMKADIPTAMMVFPARYTHSPFETAHLGDNMAMVDWLEAFV